MLGIKLNEITEEATTNSSYEKINAANGEQFYGKNFGGKAPRRTKLKSAINQILDDISAILPLDAAAAESAYKILLEEGLREISAFVNEPTKSEATPAAHTLFFTKLQKIGVYKKFGEFLKNFSISQPLHKISRKCSKRELNVFHHIQDLLRDSTLSSHKDISFQLSFGQLKDSKVATNLVDDCIANRCWEMALLDLLSSEKLLDSGNNGGQKAAINAGINDNRVRRKRHIFNRLINRRNENLYTLLMVILLFGLSALYFANQWFQKVSLPNYTFPCLIWLYILVIAYLVYIKKANRQRYLHLLPIQTRLQGPVSEMEQQHGNDQSFVSKLFKVQSHLLSVFRIIIAIIALSVTTLVFTKFTLLWNGHRSPRPWFIFFNSRGLQSPPKWDRWRYSTNPTFFPLQIISIW